MSTYADTDAKARGRPDAAAKGDLSAWMRDNITLCICTFRRESVAATLNSLALSEDRGLWKELLVLDNDDHDTARSRIEESARNCGLSVRYIHAPSRNISIARNAALENAGTRWIAFLDDDEVVEGKWLTELAVCSSDATAVIGCSVAIYEVNGPAWLASCDFHSNRISGRTDNAYTSNALIDREFVVEKGLKFRCSLGQTGGEDTVFFREMHDAGGRIAYNAGSVVKEPVPASRATMRWVLRRNFRAGQTHGILVRQYDRRSRLWLGASAFTKLAACAAMTAITAPTGVASRRWLARGALHAGAFAFALRAQVLAEYRSEAGVQPGV